MSVASGGLQSLSFSTEGRSVDRIKRAKSTNAKIKDTAPRKSIKTLRTM